MTKVRPQNLVTAHYLKAKDDKLEIKAVLLDCKHLLGSHTANALTEALFEIAHEWGIEQQISFAVSDNATNIKNWTAQDGRILLAKFIT